MSNILELIAGWRATLQSDTGADGGSWTIVRLHPGPVAAGDVFGLVNRLWPPLAERGSTRVVLEMGEVTFLSSSLIGEIVRLHKRLAIAGGALRLAAFQKPCFEALRIVRLDRVLDHYLDRREALA